MKSVSLVIAASLTVVMSIRLDNVQESVQNMQLGRTKDTENMLKDLDQAVLLDESTLKFEQGAPDFTFRLT